MSSEVIPNGIANFITEIQARLEELLFNYSTYKNNMVVYMSVPVANYLLAFCDLVLRSYAGLFKLFAPLASKFSSTTVPQAYIQHSLSLSIVILSFALVLFCIFLVKNCLLPSSFVAQTITPTDETCTSPRDESEKISSADRRRNSKILLSKDRVMNQSVKSFAAAKALTLMNNEAAVQSNRTPLSKVRPAMSNSMHSDATSPAASHASVTSRLFAHSDFETQSAASQNTDDSHSLVGLHFTPTNILSYALKNPKVLTGWRVDVAGHGKGIVLGIEKAKFFATRFKILFDDGSVKSLRLKRGPSKGSIPFTLLDTANNSNNNSAAGIK